MILFPLATAGTLTVDPKDASAFPTISAAVEAAGGGDRIEVVPGLYQECVDLAGRSLAISGVGATLDGTGCDAALTAAGGEALTVEGLRIENVGGRGLVGVGAAVALLSVTIAGAGRSDWDGGAIWMDGGTLLLDTCTLTDNVGSWGGAIYLASTTPLADGAGVYERNVATQGGGAILANYDHSLDLIGTTFRGNTSGGSGGAVWVQWYSDLTMNGVGFEANQAGGSGGALFAYALYDTVLGYNPTFVNNTAAGGGGAIEVEWSGTLELHDATFQGNVASTSYGGGIANWYNADTRLYGGRFAGNRTAAYGGAVFAYPSDSAYDLVVDGVSFHGNEAGGEGGAVWTGWVDEALVSGAVFEGNLAAGTGGGLAVYVANAARLEANAWCANQASYGGGASVQWTSTDTWTNNRLWENHAAYGGGAFRYASYAGALVNNTFAGNASTLWGGSYYTSYGYGEVRNNLVAWSTHGSGIYAQDAGSAAASPVTWNGWHENLGLDGGGYFWVDLGVDGNAGGDPRFVAFTADGLCDDDLRLYDTSPYVDAGDPALMDPDGSRSDIGAYGGPGGGDVVEDPGEPDTGTPDTGNADTGEPDDVPALDTAADAAPLDESPGHHYRGGCASAPSPAGTAGLAAVVVLLGARRRRSTLTRIGASESAPQPG